MPIWEAVLLGIVQGLTEFLPISSTAHLLLVRTLLGHAQPEDAFTVVIQLGTIVAVAWYFRSDILKLARGWFKDITSFRIGSTPEGAMAWLVILGSVPVVLAGLLLKKWLKANFYNLPAVAVVATLFALIMALAEWWTRRRTALGKPGRSEGDLGWRDALWVGAWQALALMPGASRSGTTITGGLFAGLTRPVAARFSFVLSLPAITGAGLKELYDEYKLYKTEHTGLFASGDDMTALLVGLLVSAVVGYLAIAWLLRFLKSNTTFVFIVYRLILGAALLTLIALGVLH